MEKFLMTVRLDGPKTIQAAAKALSIPSALIDANYGVVEVDPDIHLFAVLVEQLHEDIHAKGDEMFRGPFANPKIEPFGPLKRKRPM